MPKQASMRITIWLSTQKLPHYLYFWTQAYSKLRFRYFSKKLKSRYKLRNKIGDSILSSMHLAPPTIEDLHASPLFKFIPFAARNFRQSFFHWNLCDYCPPLLLESSVRSKQRGWSKLESSYEWIICRWILESSWERNWYSGRNSCLGCSWT